MTAEAQILQEVKAIKLMLVQSKSEYCDTLEAASIIGLDNTRDLKKLFDMGVLPRYQRKGSYKYKKTDCKKVAEALDNKKITIK